MKPWLRKFSKPSNQKLTGFLWRYWELRSQSNKRYISYIYRLFIIFVLIIGLSSCGGDKAVSQPPSVDLGRKVQSPLRLSGKLAEAEPPVAIQELNRSLDVYHPQVKVISPMDDEVLQTDSITVGFQVRDLPIFKDRKYGLGPHLSVILDNQPYTKVYDLQKPLTISNLTPGTHTLRVFAEKPWYESFKNDGAYSQTTFHVFTKTDDNNPQSSLPLLTYNSPNGDYGAEPILLDFYLTNAPLQASTNTNQEGSFSDWRIRCTINGDKFILDRWQSIYLKGFQKGKNWVQLEFLDDRGEPIKNVFNTTTRTINYQPKGKDTLARIVRGELTLEQVRGIIDVNYNPPAVEIKEKQVPEATPTPVIEETPIPKAESKEIITPKPEVTPTPLIEGTPIPTAKPTPEIKPTPEAIPAPIIKQEPQEEIKRKSEGLPEAVTTPIPEVTSTPGTTSKFGNFFNRLKAPKSNNTTPDAVDTDQLESDRIQEDRDGVNDGEEASSKTDMINIDKNDNPAIAPNQETTESSPKPVRTDLRKYFQRPKPSTPKRSLDGDKQDIEDLEVMETKSDKPLQEIPQTQPNPNQEIEEAQKDKPVIKLLDKIKTNPLIEKLQKPESNYEVNDMVEITPENKPNPDVVSPD